MRKVWAWETDMRAESQLSHFITAKRGNIFHFTGQMEESIK